MSLSQPNQYLVPRMNELYTPVDTIQQYMEHFNLLRRTHQAGAAGGPQGGAGQQQQQQQSGGTGTPGQSTQASTNQPTSTGPQGQQQTPQGQQQQQTGTAIKT